MGLEMIKQSELSQKGKGKYRMISLIRGNLKYDRNEIRFTETKKYYGYQREKGWEEG